LEGIANSMVAPYDQHVLERLFTHLWDWSVRFCSH